MSPRTGSALPATLKTWLQELVGSLLAARADAELDDLARIGGWRKQTRPSTPGLVKAALAGAFVHCAPLPLLGFDTQSAPKKRRTTATGPPPTAVPA